ncbi:MAG TPA: hypothetical protein VEZ26_02235 [Sphingomonadaceae bacterium]|nr:hypothetical protein [Sphingomonadaceae bacterium]
MGLPITRLAAVAVALLTLTALATVIGARIAALAPVVGALLTALFALAIVTARIG